MSNYYTVGQVREAIAPFVLESGRCEDDPEVLKFLNDARRLMWQGGDWKGLMETIILPICGSGFVTLGAEHSIIRKAWHTRFPLAERTAQFQKTEVGRQGYPMFRVMPCMPIELGDKFASFYDYFVDGRPANHRLRIVCEDDEDKGKTLTFNCIGENNNRVAETVTLLKAWDKAETNQWIINFRHVKKDATKGRIRVYVYDPNREEFEIECAIYEPDDITPNYRRYRIHNGRAGGTVEALIKKKYRPLVNETDPVEFPEDALIHACQALTKRRQKDMSGFGEGLKLSIQRLDAELHEDAPRRETQARLSPVSLNTNLNNFSSLHFPSGRYTGRR